MLVGSKLVGGKQDVTLELKRHTLAIGGQIYPLRNIARVQCLEFRPDRRRILGRLLARVLPVVAFLVLVNVVAPGNDLTAVFNVLALGTLAVLVLVDVGAATRRSRYVLLLETTGAPFSLLYSKRLAAIQELVELIGEALENPPTAPRLMHFGDVVMGDKLKQVGDRNIGKLVDG